MPGRDKDSVRFRLIDIVSDDVKMLQDEVKSLKEEIKKINELLQLKEGTKNSSSWWGQLRAMIITSPQGQTDENVPVGTSSPSPFPVGIISGSHPS